MLIDEVSKMAKKSVFGPEEVEIILSFISEKSVKYSGEAIPAYAKGYLASMLKRLAEVSPAAKRELLGDLEHIAHVKSL
jgi:hypothetical protein